VQGNKAMNGDPSPVFGSWPQVVLFGDSITQFSFSYHDCWGSTIADNLQRKVDVLNRGFSGYTSRNCRQLLPLLFNSSNVNRIVAFAIFLGANDASDPTLNPTQGVPVDEYRNNLSGMVSYLETIGLGRDKIIFITPPPLDEQKWDEHCKKNGMINAKSSQLTAEMAKMCVTTAFNVNVDVVDLHSHMLRDPAWQKFLSDGLHLTHDGAICLANFLMPTIKKRTENLPIIGPYWQLFNPDDPLSNSYASRI